jgi:hypothetical protein
MAINLSDSIRVGQQKPIDDKYYNGLNPYVSTTEANSLLLSAIRYKGLTVNINNVEYWYKTGITNGDLIAKSGGGGTWGSITGTLSAQTDLQSALDAKQNSLNGTGFVKAVGTTISYDNTTYFPQPTGTTSQYIRGDGSLNTFPTITNGTVTSIGLTMPSAFSVANSPITSSGSLVVTGAGTVLQYIRGDGQLATLPTSGGGGNNVSYYLNGGTAASVATYYQMSFDAVVGTNVDFTKSGNGLISQWLTDVNNPNQIEIKAGNWNFEMYMSASSTGGTPAFYVELLKYDGTTFTTIANSSAAPEGITGGTSIDLYLTSLAIPLTTLLATDRLAIRVYIVNSTGGMTITMHTQDGHLCQIITNFAGGISSINGLTNATQYLQATTTGTDFTISQSGTDTHTFNLPSASATNRGALSSTDWSTFNNKQPTITGAATTITTSDLTASRVLVSDASGKVAANTVTTTTLGYLDATSSIQTQLNGKQATLTNPVTGTGTSGYISKFNGTSSIAISSIFESLTTSNVGIGNLATGTEKLQVTGLTRLTGSGSSSQTLTLDGTTIGANFIKITSTGGSGVFGIESSTGATIFTGSSPSATVIGSTNATSFQIATSGAIRFTLTSTGAATFNSTLQATNIGAGIAPNVASYLNTAVNTASVGQLLLPKSAVDYTGTLAGMIWNNSMEFKFYDDVLATVNRFLKLNGNTALVNSNPLNVVTSTGVGGNLGTLKAEVAFSRYPTAVTYTILLTDVGFGWVVAVTDTTASRTINLPVANTVPSGWQTTIKDESGGALLNSITVSRSSTDTIEGATSRTINTNYGVLKLYSDGVSKWFLI